MSTERHNTAIAHAMEFTSDDLDKNRCGDLSPMQLQKLVVMRDMFIDELNDVPPLHLPSIIRLVGIGLLAGLLYVLGVFDRLQQGLDSWYRPLFLGSSLLLLGWFLWTQFRYVAVRVLLPDMLDDMIQAPALYSVTGAARLEMEEFPLETNYWLDIGDQRFPLTTSAARVFQTGCVLCSFRGRDGPDECRVDQRCPWLALHATSTHQPGLFWGEAWARKTEPGVRSPQPVATHWCDGRSNFGVPNIAEALHKRCGIGATIGLSSPANHP